MNFLIDGQVFCSPEINRGIGVYTKNVLSKLVHFSNEDNWFILLDNREVINCLPNDVQCRLITIVNKWFTPSTEYDRNLGYTRAILDAIERYSIDVYWNPDPLMVNVLFPLEKLTCKVVLTLYDLIPFIKPIYDWPETVKKEYNRRLEYISNNDIYGVCISKATETDFLNNISNSINTAVTLLAADSSIFLRNTLRDDQNPYIVYTGGFDYRKNIYAAVDAFQQALESNFSEPISKAKFYLVCKCTDEQRADIYNRIKPVYRDRIILTGFISDDELAELYAHATVFFFPSLYEGFGLPILEAMLGGAYILTADNSSLPEVAGKYASYCDATDVSDMSKKLNDAFTIASRESIDQRKARQDYATTFSWEKTAKDTYNVLIQDVAKFDYSKKYKIAIVTPWPNMQTGIANYTYRIVKSLKKYFEIDIFIDNTYCKDCYLVPNEGGNLFNITELAYRYYDYDEVIYQIGNNKEFHSAIYRYMRSYPGIAEIHDYNLSAFFYHAFYLEGKKEIFRQALIDGYGPQGADYYNELINGRPYDALYYMNDSVSKIAKASIYHNAWSVVQESVSSHDFIVPLASFENDTIDDEKYQRISSELYKKINYNNGDVIIGMFGFVNANKRYDVILYALKYLLEKYNNVKVVFWGEATDKHLFETIQNLELKENAFVMGYLNKEYYEVGLSITDIVINLRYPSMGEASGTLAEAFQHGKPVIISAVNQYLEFPDSICWKLPIYENVSSEANHLFMMLDYMIKCPEVRKTLGENALNYAKTLLNPDNVARKYYEIIKRTRSFT